MRVNSLRYRVRNILNELQCQVNTPSKTLQSIFSGNGELLIHLANNRYGSRQILIPRRNARPIKAENISSAIHVTETFLQVKGQNRPQQFLCVDCVIPELTTTFDKLVLDLVDELPRTSASPESVLREHIQKWRKLLVREVNRLNRERTIGLFGELVVMRKIAEKSPSKALEHWSGYRGHIHDFTSYSVDIEVKTTTSHNVHSLAVSGPTQLEPIKSVPLVLARIGLTEHPQGENLKDLIESIIQLGVDREKLEMTARESLRIQEDKEFDSPRYAVTTQILYHVDESFPRLTCLNHDGELPRGISKLAYEIDLTVASRLSSDEVTHLWKSLTQ